MGKNSKARFWSRFSQNYAAAGTERRTDAVRVHWPQGYRQKDGQKTVTTFSPIEKEKKNEQKNGISLFSYCHDSEATRDTVFCTAGRSRQ